MTRPSLAELERCCQKADHRRLGTWMARRVARPAALRITWLVAPWGVTANMATLGAWACGLAAAAALACGGVAGWAAGAILLQLWYLLDHVDGQLARLRQASSLDGVQLDYLMHHTVNLLVPLGIGYGHARLQAHDGWLLCGLGWGLGLLLIGLQHDARYKAFVARLKRRDGPWLVHGGGGRGSPAPAAAPRGLWPRIRWGAQKLCETHVAMNLISALALASLLVDRHLMLAQAYAAAMAPLALVVAAGTLARAQFRQAAEREFAEWYVDSPPTPDTRHPTPDTRHSTL